MSRRANLTITTMASAGVIWPASWFPPVQRPRPSPRPSPGVPCLDMVQQFAAAPPTVPESLEAASAVLTAFPEQAASVQPVPVADVVEGVLALAAPNPAALVPEAAGAPVASAVAPAPSAPVPAGGAPPVPAVAAPAAPVAELLRRLPKLPRQSPRLLASRPRRKFHPPNRSRRPKRRMSRPLPPMRFRLSGGRGFGGRAPAGRVAVTGRSSCRTGGTNTTAEPSYCARTSGPAVQRDLYAA